MSRAFSISLITTLAGVFGLAQSANAGVTIDVYFEDATSPSGITIMPGDLGPGCTFTGYYGNVAPFGYCADVLLRTTEELIGVRAGVGYTSNHGLAVASFYEWLGVGVSWNAKGTPVKSCAPMDGVTDNGLEIGRFDCAIPQPAPPGVLSPGTYRMGTIVWDTSGMTPGWDVVNVLIEAVGAVINGNVIDYTAQTFAGWHLVGSPEPSTAALLGLGLVGLVIAARRRRG